MEPSWRNALVLLVGSVFLFQSIVTAEPPAKPGNIMVTNITNASISLSWDRPAGMNATQYNFSITYRPNGTDPKILAVNFITITDLLSGTNYTITVVTIANGTDSEPVVTSVFTKPNAVASITLENRNTSSITLSWSRPLDHKSEYRYRVQTNGDPTSNITVALESVTVAQLNAGTNYNFSVFTLTADNTSSDPTTVSLTTEPNAVANITLENRNTSSITLSWSRPLDHKSEYRYRVQTNGDPTSNITVALESVTVAQLNAGTNYNFSVFTLTADNTSSDPTTVSLTTEPNAVANVTLENRNTSSITLSWSRPLDHKPEYRYRVQTNGDPTSNIIVALETVTVAQLNAGTNYNFSVFTLTADNTSSDPTAVSLTTEPNAVANVTLENRNTSSITLSWSRPLDHKPEYRYRVQTNGDPTSNIIVALESVTVAQLNAGTNYNFSVFTLTADNTSSDPTTVSLTTEPNAVASITLENRNTSSITLSWSRPLDHKSEYRYRVQTNGDPTSNITVALESVTVAQLNAGTNYNFSVFTLTADNTSSDPTTVSLTTEPNAVANVTLENRNTSSITLSWSRPLDHKPEYRYRVQTNGDPTSNIIVALESVTVAQLNAGTNYNFSVFTLTADNTSSDPTTVSLTTEPNAVANLTLGKRNNSSITLNWARPLDHKPEYRYRVQTNGDPTSNIIVALETVTVAQLNAGTNYNFSVFTLTADNTSSDPTTVSLTTEPNAVANLTLVNRNTTSITLSWARPLDHKSEYRYRVQTNGDPTSNIIVALETVTVAQLNPGTNYNFSVFTLTADTTSSDPTTVSLTTAPNEVLSVMVLDVGINFVTLTWTRPPDYKEGYQFTVMTTGNPNPTGDNGNITVRSANATIKGLTSGTTYNFTITTLTADGTQGDSVMESSYTKPAAIAPGNISVDNNRTMDTLIVSWVPPPGNVEKFFVNVQDVITSDSRTNSTDSTSPVTFTKLRPGRVYNITVITNSGPFNVTSVSVPGITFPSTPGAINVANFSTNSISLNWGAPADMDVEQYTFNVTYHNGLTTESITKNINSTTISNLTSGTNYSISVATIGPGNLQSGFVSTFHFTKPNPVRDIQIVDVGTDTITLNWTQPIEDRKDYSYTVVTMKSDASSGDNRNQTVAMKNVTVKDLIPGIRYTFTITTLAADGTQADSVTISSYTKPVQIPQNNITVSNRTTDKLTVSWIPPLGNVEKFFVIIQDALNSYRQTNSTDSTSPVTFTELQPGRVYNITVTTSSGPFNVTSNIVQGITVPSIPGTINVVTFSTNSISLNWEAPAHMDNGSYTFNVTYRNDSVTESMTVNVNSTTISSLISGTKYTISVATIGPGQLQSAFVLKIQFTKPNPVKNLQIVQIDTNSITLRWTRPDQYKAEYRYRILTDGNPAPIVNYGNQTITNETLSVMGLTPGTNYTFSIITLAEDGTPADPVFVANYTEPVKIPSENITLSNENTTDSLTVSWIHPPGRVENFIIDINDTQNPEALMNRTTVPSLTNKIVFSSLRPGRLYRVMVTTMSGPHYITSDPVTKATIPSTPGTIVVTNITNSTIEFGWSRPENMDIGTYNFTVTYNTQTSNVMSHSVEDNKTIIPGLDSGTKYTITVFTTIRENLNSISVTKPLFTKPNPIRNLNVANSDTTSINLTWDAPFGYKNNYQYRVKTDGSPSSNTTVKTNSSTVSGLTSGARFTFTVLTLVANTIEGHSVSLNHCTDAAAISSLKCEGVDRNPILRLNWACPSGVYSSFRIDAANAAVDGTLTANSSTCPQEDTFFALTNVTFFTNYSVNVTTLSCGGPSVPTNVVCRSGISRPSQPPGKLELSEISVTHKTIKFTIQEGAFNSDNGPIEAIAVIVTKDQSSNSPDGNALQTAFSTTVSTYVTYIIELQSTTSNTRGPALAAPLPVNIGNNSKSHGYVNQELTPLTPYRFSLAGFTKIKFNSDKISSSESIYSVYIYSETVTMQQDPDVVVGAVVGTILGAIIIVLLVGMLFWWKKRTKSNNKELTQLPISNIRVARNAINVDYFEGYFSKQHADSDCGFAEEYEELKPVGLLQSTQAAQLPLNKPKNRYNNVLPYDVSRVKLSVTEDPSNDYINANFVPGYNLNKEFIAAQGPLLNTVSDFWRMIWEHNVPAIIMLTKCVEQGRAKCEQYWPTERPHIYEDKTVTMTSELVLQDWTIRDFTIVKEKSKENRALRHFHFTGWPDHGVPSTTEVLIDFRNLVRQYINQYPKSGPSVVHCSAGVGRTGTFICIDHMIYQIDNNRQVDIWATVHQLRMHRPLMVQTESQYVFLNQCAMEYIRANKPQTDTIYQNTSSLIYENTSAIHAANGHVF
ncbi:receptor-type tyrosine-protein phosphatase eta isoform X1 [Scyliorhinus torazame]|uniref:receptor-type tyrosine-protein phosphatase eta isoform X1 n=1 Tax=Scyliorhinus torazame TaxID=75743 RepID=UPI003B5BE3C3